MFIDYVAGRLLERKPSYQTEAEFKSFIQKGHITISTSVMISLVSDFHKLQQEGIFNVGDKVHISFHKREKLMANVLGVHFYRNKVKYDLEIQIVDEPPTRIYNVDSDLVEKIKEPLTFYTPAGWNIWTPPTTDLTTSVSNQNLTCTSSSETIEPEEETVIMRSTVKPQEAKEVPYSEAVKVLEDMVYGPTMNQPVESDPEEFLHQIRKRKEEAISKVRTERFGTADSVPEPSECSASHVWRKTSIEMPVIKDGHNVVFLLAVISGSLFAEKLYYHREAADMTKRWFNPVTKKWIKNYMVTHWMELPLLPPLAERIDNKTAPLWRTK